MIPSSRALRPRSSFVPSARSFLPFGTPRAILAIWCVLFLWAGQALADDAPFYPNYPFHGIPPPPPPAYEGAPPETWWRECPFSDLDDYCRRYDSFYDMGRGLYFYRDRGYWRGAPIPRDYYRQPYRDWDDRYGYPYGREYHYYRPGDRYDRFDRDDRPGAPFYRPPSGGGGVYEYRPRR